MPGQIKVLPCGNPGRENGLTNSTPTQPMHDALSAKYAAMLKSALSRHSWSNCIPRRYAHFYHNLPDYVLCISIRLTIWPAQMIRPYCLLCWNASVPAYSEYWKM